MLCPVFKDQCGSDCAWKVWDRRKVDGVLVETHECVLVALARHLAELAQKK